MKNNNNNFKWTKELIEQNLDNHNYQELNKKGGTGFIKACQFQPGLAEMMLEKDDIKFSINGVIQNLL